MGMACFCLLPDQGQSPKTLQSAEKVGQGIAMERRDERELREELVNLRAEHRKLDSEIVALENNPSADQLLVKRLKKKKLVLKDRITQIEDKLLPDIIA